ncbi:SDR family oxidoreductase [Galactobacter valiniphilus]|uniref:SDR family oxidoreductase n=1 Tax=Galactobacter valiniphilus TaxID=2676122 RepID=UPI003735E111
MRITFIGGHGKVALLTLPLLTQAGHEVTAWIRNPEHAADVEATGARALVFSIEEASTESMAAALEGSEAVVFSAGAGGGNPARTAAVDRDAAIRSVHAAEEAGVRRYVMVSYHGAGRVRRVEPDHGFYPYQEAKLAADKVVASSALEWTILGPGTLSLEPSPGGVSPAAEGAEHAPTSRELVAQVIAEVLAGPAEEDSVRRTLDFHDGTLTIPAWIEAVAAGELPGAEG